MGYFGSVVVQTLISHRGISKKLKIYKKWEEGGNSKQIDQVRPDSEALFEEFTAVIVVDRWPT